MRHPVDRSASSPGAGSLAPGCGGHCARCRVFAGAGGVRRIQPCGSRGWYGARGLTPSPYPVGCPRGGNRAAALDAPREELLAADSVALFCHPLPRSGVYPSLSGTLAPRPCSCPLLSRPVVDVRSIPGSLRASSVKAGPPAPIACEGAGLRGPALVCFTRWFPAIHWRRLRFRVGVVGPGLILSPEVSQLVGGPPQPQPQQQQQQQ